MKEVYSGLKIGEDVYNIVACSVIGEGKIENQDCFKIFNDDYSIIVAVADGLGSAVYSKEGASKITDVAIDVLKNSQSVDDKIIFAEIYEKWKDGLSGNLNLYDTTIKFIKITQENILYGGIGDGWICLSGGSSIINFENKREFSNQTDSILSLDGDKRFFVKLVKSNDFDNLLLATDGFSEDFDKNSVVGFLNNVRVQIKSSIETFACDMEETLSNWPVETNKDDKTVVLITKGEIK